MLGVARNNSRIEGPQLSIPYRVPDFLSRAARTIGEVKNSGYVWGSRQIREYRQWAIDNKFTFTIYVRIGATPSAKIKDWIADGTVRWEPFNPHMLP